MEQYRWMGRWYPYHSKKNRSAWISSACSCEPHQRNRHPKSIGRIIVDDYSTIIKRFFKAGDDRIHHYHSTNVVGDEQMADGLCISHQYTMVGIRDHGVNDNYYFIAYGELSC